jgi:hypothetical protein
MSASRLVSLAATVRAPIGGTFLYRPFASNSLSESLNASNLVLYLNIKSSSWVSKL